MASRRMLIQSCFVALLSSLVSVDRTRAAPSEQEVAREVRYLAYQDMLRIHGKYGLLKDTQVHFFINFPKDGRRSIVRAERWEPKVLYTLIRMENHESSVERHSELPLTEAAERSIRKTLYNIAPEQRTRHPKKVDEHLHLTTCRIYWNGTDEAMVEGYSHYRFDDRKEGDKGAGSAEGWMYRVRRGNDGVWHILGKYPTFAAG